MRTFTKLYDDVMQDQDPRMTITMKLIYCYLLRFEESEKIDTIFPSNENIALHVGMKERAVKGATKALAELGLIIKTRRFNKSNLFEVRPYAEKRSVADSESEGGICCTSRGAFAARPEVHETPTNRLHNKIKEEISLEEQGQNLKDLNHNGLDGRTATDKQNCLEIESTSDRECAGDEECASTHCSDIATSNGSGVTVTGKPVLYIVVDNTKLDEPYEPKSQMTDDDEPLEAYDDEVTGYDYDDELLAYEADVAF